MNIFKKFLILPILGLLFVSCLNSTDQGNSRDQLVLTLQLTNINETIIAQNDTINVDSLRFLVGTTTLQNSNDSLTIFADAFQVTHQLGNSNETIELVSGFFDSDEVFSTLTFEIKQAEQSDIGNDSNIDADDFIEGESENERYSMILSGAFNGERFEFKSTQNFNFEFPFEDGSGGNQSSLLYNLPMTTDVSVWFLNTENDGLLDPREPENASTINGNIESSINLN